MGEEHAARRRTRCTRALHGALAGEARRAGDQPRAASPHTGSSIELSSVAVTGCDWLIAPYSARSGRLWRTFKKRLLRAPDKQKRHDGQHHLRPEL